MPQRRVEKRVIEVETILQRCRLGDDLAWEALVRRYQGRVFGVSMHYMRDREEARDVSQEIFLKIYRNLGSLKEGQAFLPWMLRLARNCCIDRLRRLKVRTPEIEVELEDALQVVAAGGGPDEDWRQGDRRSLLHRALAGLSEKNREMILLKEIQELKMEEIADLLSVPLGTVKSRSNRARIELARAIQGLDPSYGA